MFCSSGIKAEGVQISQWLHQGKNSNLSFSLEIRRAGPSPGPFSLLLPLKKFGCRKVDIKSRLSDVGCTSSLTQDPLVTSAVVGGRLAEIRLSTKNRFSRQKSDGLRSSLRP